VTDDIQSQIHDLRAQIAARESKAAALRAEIDSYERELAEFQSRYDKIIAPMELRLKVIQDAIDDLLKQQYVDGRGTPIYQPTWNPPPGYVSVEEQYKRKWGTPETPPENEPRSGGLRSRIADKSGEDEETRLKRLYRELARRFHPDLAADDADRDRRNEVMRRINEAYRSRDLDALNAVDDALQNGGAISAETPLAALTLRALQKQRDEMDNKLILLRQQREELLHGAMMKLKLDDKLAKLKGRDLLAEMRNKMQAEYDSLLAKLDRLRNSSG